MDGYLYILTHPEMPGYIKIGRTTRHPKKRLSEHQNNGECGQIVNSTGKLWELVHYVPVVNVRKAQALFYEHISRPAHSHSDLLYAGAELNKMILDMANGVGIEKYFDNEKYNKMLKTELRKYKLTKLKKRKHKQTFKS